MLPDLNEYQWVVPDFVWEIADQIDLGGCVVTYIYCSAHIFFSFVLM